MGKRHRRRRGSPAGDQPLLRRPATRRRPALPRLKFALLENGGGVTATEYPQSSAGDVVGPTVFGHAGARGAIAVGAVRYNDGAEPERFSSRGPVTHYFGPVTGRGRRRRRSPRRRSPSPTWPRPTAARPPSSAASQPGVWRFCGTSAAAPHAAAVAALVRQANPAAPAPARSPARRSAAPVGAFGPNAVGAGLVDAYGAVDALALPPRSRSPRRRAAQPQPPADDRVRGQPPGRLHLPVDGGAPQPCASPFTCRPLADGNHGFAVTGSTSPAGREQRRRHLHDRHQAPRTRSSSTRRS